MAVAGAQSLKLLTPLYGYSKSLPSLSSGSWKEFKPPSSTASNFLNKFTTQSKPATSSTLRILTWNIWFETHFKSQRTSALLRIIREYAPDVCCFQEVTVGFEVALKADPHFQEEWLMTSISDQGEILGTRSWYGTIVMVRKTLLQRGEGFDAGAYYVPFKGTQTGRCLTVLELLPKGLYNDAPPLRISTVHLDYTPQLRRAHLETAVEALLSLPSPDSQPVRSVLCGDTNFDDYSAEVKPLIDAGFKDAWLTSHPCDAGVDPFFVGPTFSVAGIRLRSTGAALATTEGSPRRLDLMMYHGLKVKGAVELVGKEPIPREVLLKEEVTEELVKTYEVYPSDHLGIVADLDWEEVEG